MQEEEEEEEQQQQQTPAYVVERMLTHADVCRKRRGREGGAAATADADARAARGPSATHSRAG